MSEKFSQNQQKFSILAEFLELANGLQGATHFVEYAVTNKFSAFFAPFGSYLRFESRRFRKTFSLITEIKAKKATSFAPLGCEA